MHPELAYQLAKMKMAEDLAWAERERRARLARPQPAPDAVAFERRGEYLSFSARLRVLVGSIRLTGGTAGKPAGA